MKIFLLNGYSLIEFNAGQRKTKSWEAWTPGSWEAGRQGAGGAR